MISTGVRIRYRNLLLNPGGDKMPQREYELVRALERIADALEKANKLKEEEMKEREFDKLR